MMGGNSLGTRMTDPTLYEARMRHAIAKACAAQDGSAFDQAILEWGGDPVGPMSAVAKECVNQGSLWGFERLCHRGLPMTGRWLKNFFTALRTMGVDTAASRQPYWGLCAFLLEKEEKLSDSTFITLLSDVRTWLPGDAHRCGLAAHFKGRWEEPFELQLFASEEKSVLTPLQFAWSQGWPLVCAVMLEGGASFDAQVSESDMPQWSLQRAVEGKRLCGGIRNHSTRVVASSKESSWDEYKDKPEWVLIRDLVSRLAREKQLEQTLPAPALTPKVRF